MDINNTKFATVNMQTPQLFSVNGTKTASTQRTSADSTNGAGSVIVEKKPLGSKIDINADDSNVVFAKKSDLEEKTLSESEKTVSKEEVIKKAVDSANKVILPSNRKLEYSIHEKTHQIMVKVIDTTNDEIIREIPPEKVLDSYAKMLELAGLIVDTKS